MKTRLPQFDGVAGAAFLLRDPPRKSLTLQHTEGVVTIREAGAYATVQLPIAPPGDTLRTTAWRVVQEALDIHAATRREPFATQRGDREYLLWTRAADGYRLTCVNTFDMPWSISGRVTVNSSAPPPVSVATPILHHQCFRFYRLSQLTDDLFDAYRNAYLCLECFVSDESPKGSDSETEWLKRVLGGSLLAGVPPGMDVNKTVEQVYKWGRLPLFHAKTKASFYPPQGEDRECVQLLFAKLTTLLAALFRHKFGNHFPGGWASMSQEVHDAQARAVFQFDEVVYKRESERVSVLPKVEVVSNPRRFGNPWARLGVAKPTHLTSIDGVDFLHDGQYWSGLEFPEFLPMENVAVVSFEFGLLQYNIRAPRPSHVM